MKYLAALGLATAVTGAVVAVAQQSNQPTRPPVQPIAPPSGGNYYGGYGGYGTYHSSTAAEGAMRGMGDVVRSQGQANLDNSAAAVNYSVARQNQISNYREATSAYFDMRETNRRARAAERGPKTTMEQAVRFAQAGKPKPLSPGELDFVTGQINWPMFLQTEEHAANRSELDKIFAQRASQGGIGAEDYLKAKQASDAMLADLKKQVREIPPAQYIAARQFVQSLRYEVGQPPS